MAEELGAHLDNLEQGQRDLRSATIARFAQVGNRFGHLENRLDQLRIEMDSLFGRLTALTVTMLRSMRRGKPPAATQAEA